MVRVLIILIPIVLSIVLLFSFSGKKERTECRLEIKEVVRSVYGSGRVRSEREVVLRAGVSGLIEKILVKEGERVRKGQLIAKIESSGLENKIRAVTEKIKLVEERLKQDSDFRRSLEIQLRIRKENMEKAERRYLRRKELFSKGAIPRESLEEAERQYVIVKEEYEAFKRNYRERIRELRTELKVMEEERKALEKELEKYRVRSPFDGFVLKVYVEEGDYVNHLSRENSIAVIGTEKRKVVLSIDEEFLPLIKEGQRVYVRSDAVPGEIFEGKVVGFDLQSDPSKRIVEVEVDVDIPQKIPVNSVVEGNIVIDVLKTTVVPVRFVKDGYVTLLIDGQKRKVKVKRVFDNYAEVIGFPSGTPCLPQD